MISLWLVERIPAEILMKEFLPALSPLEMEKARRITSYPRQREFICGRFLLRQVFKQELNQELPEILETNQHGKPLSPFQTSFNLSHSAGWVGLAVDEKNEVGLDLEKDDGLRDVNRLIQRYGSAGEVERFHSMDESLQRESFHQLWCLKESFGKAVGEGLKESLKDLEFDLSNRKVLRTPGNQIGHFHYARYQGLHLSLCLLGSRASSPRWFKIKKEGDRLRCEELKEASFEEFFTLEG